MSGKGDKQRPRSVSDQEWAANYERTFPTQQDKTSGRSSEKIAGQPCVPRARTFAQETIGVVMLSLWCRLIRPG